MAPSPFLSLDNVFVGVKSPEPPPRSVTYVPAPHDQRSPAAAGAGALPAPDVVFCRIFSTVLDFCIVR